MGHRPPHRSPGPRRPSARPTSGHRDPSPGPASTASARQQWAMLPAPSVAVPLRRTVRARSAGRAADQTVSRAWTGRGASRSRPPQEGQLQQHGEAGHRAAGPLDQIQRRLGGAAGGQHVVDHQHPVPGGERVLRAPPGWPRRTPGRRRPSSAGAGQLAGLAHRHHPQPGRVRDGGGDHEPARLDAGHDVEASPARGIRRSRRSPRGTPSPSANSGIRSLNTMPGLGKVRHVQHPAGDQPGDLRAAVSRVPRCCRVSVTAGRFPSARRRRPARCSHSMAGRRRRRFRRVGPVRSAPLARRRAGCRRHRWAAAPGAGRRAWPAGRAPTFGRGCRPAPADSGSTGSSAAVVAGRRRAAPRGVDLAPGRSRPRRASTRLVCALIRGLAGSSARTSTGVASRIEE